MNTGDGLSFLQLMFDWETPQVGLADCSTRGRTEHKRGTRPADKRPGTGGRRERRTMVHAAEAITPAMLSGPRWQRSAACATSPLNFVDSDPATTTAAMALCRRCPVLWDCLNAQHRSHPRARSVGVIAGTWWTWEANGKRIVVGAAQDAYGPFCPHCSTRFENPRAQTVHAQRCAEAWAAKLLCRIDAIHRATDRTEAA